MIPTGFAKYFSYSSSVYLVMSTDCMKTCKQTLNYAGRKYLLESIEKNQKNQSRHEGKD
jgi:hypothetical protein